MAYVPSQNVTNNIAFLMEEMNFPYELAVAYTANQMGESGHILNPLARNPASGATGYSQWLGPRLENLNKFRETLPANTPEFIVQQKFFQKELTPGSGYTDSLSLDRHNAILNQYNASGGMTLPDLVKGVEKAFFRSRPGGYENELSFKEQQAFNESIHNRIRNAELLTGKNLGAGWYKNMANQDINPMDLMNYVNAPRKTLMGGLSDLFTDNQGKTDRSLDRASLFGDLALAFNSMRLRPDPNLAQGLIEGGKTTQELKLLRDNKNKTIQWLRANNRTDLIPLVGTMKGDELIELAQTNPNEYTKEQASTIMALSKQAYDVLGSFKERRDAYHSVVNAFETGGGISDYTLVTQYAKLLDPRSAVNNKEADAIAGAGGVLSSVVQTIAQNIASVRNGDQDESKGFLPDDVRRQIANLTIDGYKRASEEAINLIEGFYEQGRAFGVKPGDESYVYRNTNPKGTDWRTAWTGDDFRTEHFIDVSNAEPPQGYLDAGIKELEGISDYPEADMRNAWKELSNAEKRRILIEHGMPN